MIQKIINTPVDSGFGDTLKVGSDKINANFDYLTGSIADLSSSVVVLSDSIANITASVNIDTGSFVTTSSFNAFTASVNIDTGSFVTTSSFNAFTASININTGSFVTTASFNAFTASYNSGSFSGSFNGDGSRLTGIIATQASNTVITVKNLSGATIAKGTPLYLTDSGTSGNLAGAYPADAGNPARMPAGAIAGESLAAGAEGIGLVNGFIQGVNTTGFTSGAEVFVAVGGGYTQTAPTGSALVQKLGNIEKVGTNGSGVINGPGTYRAVPNITPGHVWVGNNDHVAVLVSTSSFGGGSDSVYQYQDKGSILPLSGSNEITGSYGYNNIAGGVNNKIQSTLATPTGYATIGGGVFNIANGLNSVVAGGSNNWAISGSSVLGGVQNRASGTNATIGGGTCNTVTSMRGVVTGGRRNCVTGTYSSILGGHQNTISSTYSSILGGDNNIAQHTGSFILGRNITSTADNTTHVDNLSAKGQAYAGVVTASLSGSHTFDWNEGNLQIVTLTDHVTASFSNAKIGATYIIEVNQNATGNHNLVWPNTVTWANGEVPTLTGTSGSVDIVTFVYTGVYRGILSTNFG